MCGNSSVLWLGWLSSIMQGRCRRESCFLLAVSCDSCLSTKVSRCRHVTESLRMWHVAR